MNRRLVALVVTLLAAQAAGCDDAEVGGDSSDLSIEDACLAYGEKLCDLACACDETCTYSMGSGTIGFDDEDGCRQLYTLCGVLDPDEDFDFVGCTAALDDATCVAGTDVMVLMHPECDTGSN